VIYKASRFGNTDFGVAHYAGEVVYSVETFLMKNTDKLSKDGNVVGCPVGRMLFPYWWETIW
jgi:myosin heavy subunit